MPVRGHPAAVDRRTATGLWFLVLGCSLWGAGGLTGTLLAREAGLSPLAVAAYRLGVGGLLIVAVLVAGRRSLPRGRAARRRIAAVGALAALFQASYFAAVAQTSVSLGTLLTIGASPLLVLLAEALGGRRRIGARALLTAGLAVAGLTLLVGVPADGPGPAAMLAGGGFALLAAAAFAVMTLIGARPVPGLDDLTATGAGFTLGAVVLVPFAATAGGGLGFAPTPAALGLLLLLGAGPTAIAWAAYFRGLRTTAAGTAALMALLEPLVGTALAVLILGDRLGLAAGCGAALLIVALALESLPAAPPAAAA